MLYDEMKKIQGTVKRIIRGTTMEWNNLQTIFTNGGLKTPNFTFLFPYEIELYKCTVDMKRYEERELVGIAPASGQYTVYYHYAPFVKQGVPGVTSRMIDIYQGIYTYSSSGSQGQLYDSGIGRDDFIIQITEYN